VNEQAIRAFLHQFQASRKEFEDWPHWMKESAKEAVAAFPKMQRGEEAKIAEEPTGKDTK
jgi:hypothetical protein